MARNTAHTLIILGATWLAVGTWASVATCQTGQPQHPFAAFGGLFEPARGYLYMPSYEDRTIEAFLARDGIKVWTYEGLGELLGVRDGLLFVQPTIGTIDRAFSVFVIDTADGHKTMDCGPIALPSWWGDGPYSFALDVDVSVDDEAAYLTWTATAQWRPDLLPDEPSTRPPHRRVARCARADSKVEEALGDVPRAPFHPTIPVAAYPEFDPTARHVVSEDLRYMLEGHPIREERDFWDWKVIDVARGEKVGSFDGPLPLRFIMDRRTVAIEIEAVKTLPRATGNDAAKKCPGAVDIYSRKLQGRRLRSGKLKWERTVVRSVSCSFR